MAFEDCCQLRLNGTIPASSPEELMRSRFTAFCCEDDDYLVRTHKSNQSHVEQKSQLRESFKNTQWQSLRIIGCSISNGTGTVEFAAFYLADGHPGQLHERSRFVKEDGYWFYLDGEILSPIKLNRNDPCRCGSGKKQKKCCNN